MNNHIRELDGPTGPNANARSAAYTPNPNQIQQGDITLEKIDRVPKGFHLVKRSQNGVILAESTVTRNRHYLTAPGVKHFRNDKGEQVIVNENDRTVALKHSARDGGHKPLIVAPGVHRVGGVNEMDHVAQMKRKVVD